MVQIVVSNEKMLEALRDVARENPDRTYDVPQHMIGRADASLCFYVHSDPETGEESPGCLIAHALVKVGVPVERMKSWEGSSAELVASSLTSGLRADTLDVLARAQDHQDAGYSWGDALNYAEMRPAGVEF
jgi:hypothetical protein